MYVIWIAALLLLMWRVKQPLPTFDPMGGQPGAGKPGQPGLPAITAGTVLQVLTSDDAAFLAELRRLASSSSLASRYANWSDWFDAYYQGAGGTAPFEKLAGELKESKGTIQLVVSPAPRASLTYEQIHNLVVKRSAKAPDLVLVEPEVYRKLLAAGDLLPIREEVSASGASASGSSSTGSSSGAGPNSGGGSSDVYGIPDTRSAQLALRRAYAARRQADSRARPGETAALTTAVEPEMLVILKTTPYPRAAREVAERFGQLVGEMNSARDHAWSSLIDKAREAGSPIPTAAELERL